MSLPVYQEYQSISYDGTNIYTVPYGYEQQTWVTDLPNYEYATDLVAMDVDSAMFQNGQTHIEVKNNVKLGRKCIFHTPFLSKKFNQ